jgi:hypothetical protein
MKFLNTKPPPPKKKKKKRKKKKEKKERPISFLEIGNVL